jgi:hypothetical protein
MADFDQDLEKLLRSDGAAPPAGDEDEGPEGTPGRA